MYVGDLREEGRGRLLRHLVVHATMLVRWPGAVHGHRVRIGTPQGEDTEDEQHGLDEGVMLGFHGTYLQVLDPWLRAASRNVAIRRQKALPIDRSTLVFDQRTELPFRPQLLVPPLHQAPLQQAGSEHDDPGGQAHQQTEVRTRPRR